MPITHPGDKAGLPPPSPVHLCYTMFRTLGHYYIIQKYLFRLSSLMPSWRWYKGL